MDGKHYAVKFMKKHEIIKLKQVQGRGLEGFLREWSAGFYPSRALLVTVVVYSCPC